MFHGRLILGISDKLPPPADISSVKIVSEVINEVCRR